MTCCYISRTLVFACSVIFGLLGGEASLRAQQAQLQNLAFEQDNLSRDFLLYHPAGL